MTAIELPALRGDSVLGFLAAVGTQRMVVDELGDAAARIGWPGGPLAGAVLETSLTGLDELVERLVAVAEETRAAGRLLPGVDDFPPTKAPSGNADPTSGLALADTVGWLSNEDPARHRWVPSVVGLVPPIDRKTRERGALEKNRFLRAGTGKVWVARTLNKALERTNERTLREGLVGWRRHGDFLGAYLDPRADVDKATGQHHKETKAPLNRGVPGATFLALMALPMFPVRSAGPFDSETVGWWSQPGMKGFRWPVWNEPVEHAGVRALVDHPAVHRDPPRDAALQALGVDAVFRSARKATPRYDAAMAPATVVWERGG